MRSTRLLALVALLFVAAPALAQTPAAPPASFDDAFRLIHRDAFRMLQIETAPRVFALDSVATQMIQLASVPTPTPAPVDVVAAPPTTPVASKINTAEGLKRTITKTITVPLSPTVAAFDAAVRLALPGVVATLGKDLSAYTKIGLPPHPATGSDSVATADRARGLVLMTRYKTTTNELTGVVTHQIILQVIAG